MRHPSPISSPGKGYDLQIIILFILELQNWLYFKSSFKFNKIDGEERDLVNIFASLSLKPSNLPARDAPWKWLNWVHVLSWASQPSMTLLTVLGHFLGKIYLETIGIEPLFNFFVGRYSRSAILFKYIQNEHEACTRRGRWLQSKFRFSINSSFDLFSSVSAASSSGFGTEKRPNPPRRPAQPPSARLAAEDGGCSRRFASLSTQASIWFLRFRLLCPPGSAPKKDPTRLGGPPSRLAPA
ncbi:unnamed protein product [Prunus armeniaca]